jgi:hypothetical protein
MDWALVFEKPTSRKLKLNPWHGDGEQLEKSSGDVDLYPVLNAMDWAVESTQIGKKDDSVRCDKGRIGW